MAVQIFTDSTAYISIDQQEELGIRVMPLSVHFSDESFVETEVDYDYFYGKIEKTGEIPTSSQPPVGDMYNAFKEIIQAGNEVLAIFISSAMSGTYQTAVSVKEQLVQEIPGACIEVLDSRTNCMALGMQVLEAARCIKAGQHIKEAIRAAEMIRERVHFYFVPETLEYLRKGGRMGTASALLGTILKIRPILTVDMKAGMTHLWGKARGQRRLCSGCWNCWRRMTCAMGCGNHCSSHKCAGKGSSTQTTAVRQISLPHHCLHHWTGDRITYWIRDHRDCIYDQDGTGRIGLRIKACFAGISVPLGNRLKARVEPALKNTHWFNLWCKVIGCGRC